MIEADRALCTPQTNSSSKPDPIHMAIETCRKTQQFFEWVCARADQLGEDHDALIDILVPALEDFCKTFAETVPTTTAA
jgi:hypothetical protein